MKKTLCLILALILAVGMFSGCGKNENSSIEVYSKKDLSPEKIGDYGKLKLPFANGEKIEIVLSSNTTNLEELLVFQELEKRTGVDIELTIVPPSAAAQKTNVILASKNLPHIMSAGDKAGEYGAQGAFVKLDENLDLMPNFKEIFYDNTEKYNTTDYINWIKAADGHIYQFPVWDIQRG